MVNKIALSLLAVVPVFILLGLSIYFALQVMPDPVNLIEFPKWGFEAYGVISG
jgi:hypothetical protein